MARLNIVDGGHLIHSINRDVLSGTAIEDSFLLHDINVNRNNDKDDLSIVVWDSSPYWRSTIFPPYKTGRKPKSDLVREIQKRYPKETTLPSISLTGFEADDLAAAVVKLFDKRTTSRFDSLHMQTADQDWAGLVRPNVFWHGLGNNKTKFVDEKNLYDLFITSYVKAPAKRTKEWPCPTPEEFTPADFYFGKSLWGDSGDTIIIAQIPEDDRHVLLPIMDLLNPGLPAPEKAIAKQIKKILDNQS